MLIAGAERSRRSQKTKLLKKINKNFGSWSRPRNPNFGPLRRLIFVGVGYFWSNLTHYENISCHH